MAHDHGVHDFLVLKQGSIDFLHDSLDINLHILSNLAGIRQRKDVGSGFQTKSPFIFIIVFQTGRPDSHELAFSEPSELQIEHLAEPNLVALVKNS